MPRKLFLGPFQPALEFALASEIAADKKAHGPVAPIRVVVPTRVLGLHLRRTLAPHVNLHFQTFSDLLPPTDSVAPPLGLELLCTRIAREIVPREGYFSPVRDTKGFANALLETFTDLKDATITPDAFRRAAKTKKLKELSVSYAEFCRWLDEHKFQTEADLLQQAQPSTLNAQTFLYGFYDLNAAQKRFVQELGPSAVFFPWPDPGAPYAQPLLDWFKSVGYKAVSSPLTTLHAPRSTILSCPGEAAEVREAVRAVLAYLRDHPDKTFNDVAIVCRSREQYDALFRDTFRHLGIPTCFRGGRPIGEHIDAKLFRLLLEAIRGDYSRSAVLELAGHLGHPPDWDALSVALGIIGGKQQWLKRLAAPRESRSFSKRSFAAKVELERFVHNLFDTCDRVRTRSSWQQFAEAVLAAWQKLGGRHEPVRKTIQALRQLDEFESPVEFDTFADGCVRALDSGREPSGRFQGGGVFLSDVMGARGLSFSWVVVLGLVEKSFPRLVREDPLLLDNERTTVSPDLPLKGRGHDEERLLFALATACARDQLVLSYPRLEPSTSRSRMPSYLLLEHAGVKTFQALEEVARRIPLSPVRTESLPLETREFDLPALGKTAVEPYLARISRLLPAGWSGSRARWHNRELTVHDGVIAGREALQLLRERFVLEKLVISATSLEDLFHCPFYYFQKHVLGLEPWEEPEAALTIDAADLGSLYHAILEDYYRQQPGADLAAVVGKHLTEFEQNGVTGYAAIWELRKQIVREEISSFVSRERADTGGWTPVEFEREFREIAVAPPVRLRGKIDRIDRDAGGTRLRVLDYKTGRFKKGLKDDDFARGEALQLALYLLAAEKLFPDKSVESARYLYFTLRGGYRVVSFSRAALAERKGELNQMLQTAADLVRDGVFAQYAPTKTDPCRACEFRPICGNGIHKLYRLKNEDARLAAFRALKKEES
jgi:ATP-dependent helicase/nuclease subunit B